MNQRLRILFVAWTLAVGAHGFPVAATAQIVGDELLGEVSWAYEGTGVLSLYSLPDGSGHAFSAAFEFGTGGTVDATISLTLHDLFNRPIANFPAEDIWLHSTDNGMTSCSGGATADSDTDAAGMTYWSSPLRAGGNSETLCWVAVNGMDLTDQGGLPLHFNSADITTDGVVNLTDAAFFASYLGGPWVYAADFNFDGVVNLIDAGFMAQALGISCP